eukprot:12408492-Karenia_brevis.AAC.1
MLCGKVQTANAAIFTPPCNTHSRVLQANPNKPPPVHNERYPRGFPGLVRADKARFELANLRVDRSLDFLDWAASINPQ